MIKKQIKKDGVMMKYSEWSKQYSNDAEKIRDCINELKAQQETAPPSEPRKSTFFKRKIMMKDSDDIG